MTAWLCTAIIVTGFVAGGWLYEWRKIVQLRRRKLELECEKLQRSLDDEYKKSALGDQYR